MIQFGLRLHDAEKLPIEQVLPLVRQKGFSCPRCTVISLGIKGSPTGISGSPPYRLGSVFW